MNKKNNFNRVVVTGLGVVSSIGIGWEEFWKNLLIGKSGITKISLFNTSDFDRECAGEVKNFKYNSKRSFFLGRATKMAIVASNLAIADAGHSLRDLKKRRSAIFVGTTAGESSSLEKFNKYKVVYNNRGLFYKHNILNFPANNLRSEEH